MSGVGRRKKKKKRIILKEKIHICIKKIPHTGDTEFLHQYG